MSDITIQYDKVTSYFGFMRNDCRGYMKGPKLLWVLPTWIGALMGFAIGSPHYPLGSWTKEFRV